MQHKLFLTYYSGRKQLEWSPLLECSPTLYIVIVTRGAVATVDGGWGTESGVGATLRLTSDIAAIQDQDPRQSQIYSDTNTHTNCQ